MNRDTLCSVAIADISKGATLTAAADPDGTVTIDLDVADKRGIATSST